MRRGFCYAPAVLPPVITKVNTMNEITPTGTGYPVTYDVQPQRTDRNRVTVFFRIILAIPHLILVGGPGFSAAFSVPFSRGRGGF